MNSHCYASLSLSELDGILGARCSHIFLASLQPASGPKYIGKIERETAACH